VSDGLDAPGLPMPEELRRISAAGLAYAPGTSWRYSVAIDVLGAVIERVTSQSLPDAVEALVTKPIGMNDTGFAPPDRRRLATPYVDGAPPERMRDPYLLPFFGLAGISFSPGRTFDPRSFPSGGAGMNGTAGDLAQLLEVVRSGGGKILKPTTAHAMLSNQTGNFPVLLGPGWGWGYGGAVLTDPKTAKTPQSPGTWSWGGVWGHSWFVDPERRLVVVAFTNTAVEGMSGKFTTDIRDAVYGKKSDESK
jgi:CubicO group peptidase (beta-lactamase class C family)